MAGDVSASSSPRHSEPTDPVDADDKPLSSSSGSHPDATQDAQDNSTHVLMNDAVMEAICQEIMDGQKAMAAVVVAADAAATLAVENATAEHADLHQPPPQNQPSTADVVPTSTQVVPAAHSMAPEATIASVAAPSLDSTQIATQAPSPVQQHELDAVHNTPAAQLEQWRQLEEEIEQHPCHAPAPEQHAAASSFQLHPPEIGPVDIGSSSATQQENQEEALRHAQELVRNSAFGAAATCATNAVTPSISPQDTPPDTGADAYTLVTTTTSSSTRRSFCQLDEQELLQWILHQKQTNALRKQDILDHIAIRYPEFVKSKTVAALKVWIMRFLKRHFEQKPSSNSCEVTINSSASIITEDFLESPDASLNHEEINQTRVEPSTSESNEAQGLATETMVTTKAFASSVGSADPIPNTASVGTPSEAFFPAVSVPVNSVSVAPSASGSPGNSPNSMNRRGKKRSSHEISNHDASTSNTTSVIGPVAEAQPSQTLDASSNYVQHREDHPQLASEPLAPTVAISQDESDSSSCGHSSVRNQTGSNNHIHQSPNRYVLYSHEFKLNALRMLDEGKTMAEVAEILHLKSHNTLVYWNSIRDKLQVSEKKRFRLAGGGRKSSCDFEQELVHWVEERQRLGQSTDVKMVLEYLHVNHPSFTHGKKEPTLRKWILRFFKRCCSKTALPSSSASAASSSASSMLLPAATTTTHNIHVSQAQTRVDQMSMPMPAMTSSASISTPCFLSDASSEVTEATPLDALTASRRSANASTSLSPPTTLDI